MKMNRFFYHNISKDYLHLHRASKFSYCVTCYDGRGKFLFALSQTVREPQIERNLNDKTWTEVKEIPSFEP